MVKFHGAKVHFFYDMDCFFLPISKFISHYAQKMS